MLVNVREHILKIKNTEMCCNMSIRIQSVDYTDLEEHIIRKHGIVYTPEILSEYLAEKTLHYILADPIFKKKNSISITDPACGSGILLRNIARLLSRVSAFKKIDILGFDIDEKALESCKNNLSTLDSKFNTVTFNANSLCLFGSNNVRKKLPRITSPDKFDVMIANPPWGADMTTYKKRLNSANYATLAGQSNSFELFMEMATKTVRKGGYFAFIIPDSILNHGKSAIRDILIKSTEIKFIGRLGEKIFPKINRACAIIICKNYIPVKNSMIDCFRLSSVHRNKILSGMLSFSEAEQIHTIPQIRFAGNTYRQFDIDLREDETKVVSKIQKTSKTLKTMLSSTRGVELGKSGMITSCNQCGECSPVPKTARRKCNKCYKEYLVNKYESIVSKKPVSNSKPLITGDDMRRYVAKPSKWIKLGKKGINYKSEDTFKSPKILVRKTGVGITAALDYTSSYTNQVVYILQNKCKNNPSLEFFISLINSRVYYFFLIKTFGELEWKSHPYLTQSQILSLPLPDMESEKNKKIISKIISLVKIHPKFEKPSPRVDMEIEVLVGKLFSLTKLDYATIFNTINKLDELLPVKELKNFNQKMFLDKFGR